ncbi:MAG: hypothetical protein KGL16_08535, partial [Acidobacteriota bacterium]|nr:hypothetical protein [Acidobacteriota bacterium]
GGLGGGAGGFRGRPGAGPTHFSSATLKSFVACVRRDGYPGMPEANAKGRFPRSVETNRKFETASRKCLSILFHRPTTTGSTTSTTSSA